MLDGRCDHGAPAVYDAEILAKVPEALRRARGERGVPLPDLLEGRTVVVLRCGSGLDCSVLGSLVGPKGKVVGLDLDPEALAFGRQHVPPNVDLCRGPDWVLPFVSGSVDVVLTSCALPMVAEPLALFREVHRVLALGGELILSEVVADRRLSRRVRLVKSEAPCLGRALYASDLRRALGGAGFEDVRPLFARSLPDRDRTVRWSQVTMRAFRLDLEDACEDYGQRVAYRGTMPGHPDEYALDEGHRFTTDVMVPVCKNTADMISKTRYAPHFEVTSEGLHRGLFDCSGEQRSVPCTVSGCC